MALSPSADAEGRVEPNADADVGGMERNPGAHVGGASPV
jgi:hypothetical protein